VLFRSPDLAVDVLRAVADLPLANPDPDLYSKLYYNLVNSTFRYRDSQGDPREDIFLEAIELYTRATEIKPDYANAHYGLGWSYRMLNNRAEAIIHYKEALRINPNHVNANNDYTALQETMSRNRDNRSKR